MIAMGLMTEPRLLIADEPTTALDVTIQAQIMDLLDQIGSDHRQSLILISHNLGLIRQNTDRALVMYSGRVVEEISTDALDRAAHPYTRALLAAVPDLRSARGGRLADISGRIPDPHDRPSGCAFHPRCPVAMERCRVDQPLLEVQPGRASHRVACWAAGGQDR
jgi:oligopeptide/dipeptide ABC transporter ATP-binding protein